MISLFRGRKVFVEAVREINLDIEVGEVVGFIEPNGTGKTTTLKMLSGILYPSSGEVEVLGFIPSKREKAFLKNITFVTGQRSRLFWDLPAGEYFNFCKVVYEVPEEVYQNNLKDLVELAEIGDILTVPQRKLSVGQRRRCELVAALLHDPSAILLDEPTNALHRPRDQPRPLWGIHQYQRRRRSRASFGTSWDHIEHPREVLEVGQEIKVKVINVDREKKRIGLSVRALQDDPCQSGVEKYSVGQLVEGRITRLTKFGAFARLDDDIEGLIHISEMADHRIEHPKEVLRENDVKTLRVIRIDADQHRIGLSLPRVDSAAYADKDFKLLAAEFDAEEEDSLPETPAEHPPAEEPPTETPPADPTEG